MSNSETINVRGDVEPTTTHINMDGLEDVQTIEFGSAGKLPCLLASSQVGGLLKAYDGNEVSREDAVAGTANPTRVVAMVGLAATDSPFPGLMIYMQTPEECRRQAQVYLDLADQLAAAQGVPSGEAVN